MNASPNITLNISQFSYWIDIPGTIEAVHSIPTANLVSFTVVATGRTGSVAALQALLSASVHLQTLKFLNKMPFLSQGGRLPPMKSLSLPYGESSWNYSSDNANLIWDFSRLEDLEITWQNLSPFLQSVSPRDLCRLKRLSVDGSCWEISYTMTPAEKYLKDKKCTELIEKLLEDRDDFEDLDVRCLLESFDMSLISAQRLSLKKLKILDVAGFVGDGMFPTVSLADLGAMRDSCLRITSLEIGINILGDDVSSLSLVSRDFSVRVLT